MSKENCSNKMQESVKLFREKYPEGKISVNVSQSNGCVMARARIYPKYNEEERCYLSEITIAKAMNDSNSFETLISETQYEAVSLAIQTACSFGGNQPVVVTDTSKKEEVVEADIGYFEKKGDGVMKFLSDIQKGVKVCGEPTKVHHYHKLENGMKELSIYRRFVDIDGKEKVQKEVILEITGLDEDEGKDEDKGKGKGKEIFVNLFTSVSIDGNVTFSLKDDNNKEIGSAVLKIDF